MSSMVTVLIPFYNPGKYLPAAVESVFRQIYGDWKLILIDDGSTQPYFSSIRKYLRDPRVKLVRLSKNVGQSRALNQGLKFVETPFIVQLDADDWFYPHTLDILVREARKQPEHIAVLSGNIQIIHEDTAGNRVMTEVYKGRKYKDKYDFLLANSSVWPRFYRTSALRSIGGWPTDDPYRGRYLEDKRILLRLIEKYQFHWIDYMLYNHRRHTHNQTNHIKVYAEMAEWTIRNALRRWGNEYDPVIVTYGLGWKKVERLTPKTNQATASQQAASQVNSSALTQPYQQASEQRPVKPSRNSQQPMKPSSAPYNRGGGIGTGPYTGPGTAPGTGPGT